VQPKSSSHKSVIFGICVVICIWLSLAGAFFLRHDIFAWWRLRDYTPPAEVVQLAEETTMNADTKRLFYVYHPKIEPSDSFNAHCRDSEYTIVLGCYISYQGIYIFDIDDARLDGVLQVTAAHEVLHAAYEQLSVSERARVDGMLARTFADLSDDRIENTIEQYRKNDPESVPNELHSIIATEVRLLPPELETYYKKYFTDRSKIVDYSEKYEAAFSSRKNQIEAIAKELKELKQAIDEKNTELKVEGTDLSARGAVLQRRADSGELSQSELNDYNADVDKYNAKGATTSRLITSYNAKREQYLQLVGEQDELFSEIDSRPKALQSQ
jgi:uncharacterized membrane protein